MEYFWFDNKGNDAIIRVEERLLDHNNNIMLKGYTITKLKKPSSQTIIYYRNYGWTSICTIINDATKEEWDSWNIICNGNLVW